MLIEGEISAAQLWKAAGEPDNSVEADPCIAEPIDFIIESRMKLALDIPSIEQQTSSDELS